MIRVCFVRGKYLNNYEGQNYIFDSKDIRLTGVSSFYPIHKHLPFPIKKYLSITDIPFIKGGIRFLANRLIGDSQILFGLEKLKADFDVFHTADPHYFYSFQLARLRKRNLIKRLIATSWETIPFNNESVAKKREIKYFVLDAVDYFIVHTEKAKRVLVKEGVIEKKIFLIKLGVDLDRFKIKTDKIARSRKFVKNKQITILFVGRLVEEKGVMDLYEAFKEISFFAKASKDKQNIKLKIIGEGNLGNKLINRIRKDGLTKEVYIGERNYGEMPEIYQHADIFVLPSKTTKTWEEQYGMVLVEAMASGLPIVAYKTGAISEILGNAGILVKEGNIKELYRSLKHLIEEKETRLKLGRIGRERAQKFFDSTKTAKMIKNIYFQLV